MSQSSFADHVTAFTASLEAIEARMASGDVPRESVADFKSSVDDLRLRLWVVLSMGSVNDYRAFQERFRLQRAAEICRGLEDDLRVGALSTRHDELGPLGEAATRLAACVKALQSAPQ